MSEAKIAADIFVALESDLAAVVAGHADAVYAACHDHPKGQAYAQVVAVVVPLMSVAWSVAKTQARRGAPAKDLAQLLKVIATETIDGLLLHEIGDGEKRQ